jgi:hypothetical protein
MLANDPRLFEKLMDFGERLEFLEKKIAASAVVGVRPTSQPVADDNGVATQARHDSLVEGHRAEVVDGNWGPKSELTIRTILEEMRKKAGYTVDLVDCRSESCLVTARWPSLAEAQQAYGQLLNANYGDDLNCSREMLLPQAGDPTQSVEATLVLGSCRRH